MICSHCYEPFSINAIENQRGNGLAAQIQCPHCDAWIGRSPTLAKLKMLGFYIALAMIAVYFLLPDYKTVAIAVGIFAVIILMVGHFMGQVTTMERPPQEEVDDSKDRQKYR